MTTVNFPPELGGDDVTIDDTDNPSTGLGNGGHRLRFALALQQFMKVALWSKNTAQTVLGYRDAAASSAGAAAGSASAAALSATGAAASAATARGAASEAASTIAPISVADYAGLRAYAGTAATLHVTGYLVALAPAGIAGTFVRDDSDTTSADDGAVVLVAANGKRWKRVYQGGVNVKWFGATPNDITAAAANVTAIQAAVNLYPHVVIDDLYYYSSTIWLSYPAVNGKLAFIAKCRKISGNGQRGVLCRYGAWWTQKDGGFSDNVRDGSRFGLVGLNTTSEFSGPGAYGGGYAVKLSDLQFKDDPTATLLPSVATNDFGFRGGHVFLEGCTPRVNNVTVYGSRYGFVASKTIGAVFDGLRGQGNGTLVTNYKLVTDAAAASSTYLYDGINHVALFLACGAWKVYKDGALAQVSVSVFNDNPTVRNCNFVTCGVPVYIEGSYSVYSGLVENNGFSDCQVDIVHNTSATVRANWHEAPHIAFYFVGSGVTYNGKTYNIGVGPAFAPLKFEAEHWSVGTSTKATQIFNMRYAPPTFVEHCLYEQKGTPPAPLTCFTVEASNYRSFIRGTRWKPLAGINMYANVTASQNVINLDALSPVFVQYGQFTLTQSGSDAYVDIPVSMVGGLDITNAMVTAHVTESSTAPGSVRAAPYVVLKNGNSIRVLFKGIIDGIANVRVECMLPLATLTNAS